MEFMPEHTRYINPLVDFSLRKISGSGPSKAILIAFLKDALILPNTQNFSAETIAEVTKLSVEEIEKL